MQLKMPLAEHSNTAQVWTAREEDKCACTLRMKTELFGITDRVLVFPRCDMDVLKARQMASLACASQAAVTLMSGTPPEQEFNSQPHVKGSEVT